MTRGPKPKPTRLKILTGNPGKRPMNTNEPRSKGGLPTPPRHLSASVRKVWKRLREQIKGSGIATSLDTVAFEMLCKSYADYLDACEKVSQFGAVWIDKGEAKIPKFAYSPYWAVMNREWKKVQTMLVEFGLTPSSRSRVQASPDVAADQQESRFFG